MDKRTKRQHEDKLLQAKAWLPSQALAPSTCFPCPGIQPFPHVFLYSADTAPAQNAGGSLVSHILRKMKIHNFFTSFVPRIINVIRH